MEKESPKCADGRHFQCARWWWVMKDKIALTCFCWCHEHPSWLIGNSGPH